MLSPETEVAPVSTNFGIDSPPELAVMICSAVCRLLPIVDLPVAATRCRILTSTLVSSQGGTSGNMNGERCLGNTN